MDQLPVVGDIIQTRYITAQYGRFTRTTFWWRIILWNDITTIRSWVTDVAFRYMTSLVGWVNRDHLITCCHFKNLSTPQRQLIFEMAVSGAVEPFDSPVVQSAVWVTRRGTDSLGIARRSSFPISCLAVGQAGGRALGDGQPPQLEDFLIAEQVSAPFFPTRWVGGFISTFDGQFVQSTSGKTNPVIKSLRTRTRRCANRLTGIL